MNKGLSILILSVFSCILATSALATVPKLINYSGKLTDKEGNILPDKVYDMHFSLWTAQTNGSKEWWEEHYEAQGRGIQSYGGGFNVVLGGTNPLPVFDQNYRLQLTVTIKGKPETFARQELITVPYAMRAEWANQVADNAVTTGKLQNSAVTSAKIASGTITSGNIGGGQIGNTNIANNAVTQVKAQFAPKVAVNGAFRNNPIIVSGFDLTGNDGKKTISLSDYGFTQTPNVVCIPGRGDYSYFIMMITNVSTSSFSVLGGWPGSGVGAATYFYWIAVGY